MNKTTNNKKDNTKKTKRRAYESLLLLLLTISLFITATFAWFTDSAFSKGNKVFAGNLYVDIIVSEEDLKEQLLANFDDVDESNVEEYITNNYANYKYVRTYEGADGNNVTDTYYRISAMPDTLANGLSSINLYNVEPGQAKKVHVQYLNNGDLAFKAGGALKLEYDTDSKTLKSYTGLETLNQQINPDAKVGTYKNNYSVNESNSTKEVSLLYRTASDSFGNSSASIKIGVGVIDGKVYDLEVIDFVKGDYMHEEELDTAKSKAIGLDYDALYVLSPENDTERIIHSAIRTALQQEGGEPGTKNVPVFDTINPERILQGIDSTRAEYDYYNVSIDNMDKTQYEKRFKKLLAMQGVEIKEGTTSLKPVQKYTFNGNDIDTLENYGDYYDNGGHLEDVLEVYVGVPSDVEHEVFETKDSKYYFGNLHEFTFLMENGPTANPDFDYASYIANPDALSTINAKFAEKAKAEAQDIPYTETIYPEEEYMYLYQNVNANLNEDYQNYLKNAGGYCIPKDVISNNGVVPSKDGVNVKIYEKDGTTTEQLASEIGGCDFIIYMPTDVDSRYQNASISLQLGVTATQAEFEMDDTGYMVYDKFGEGNSTTPEKGDLISISVPSHAGSAIKNNFRVLDTDDSGFVTLLSLNPVLLSESIPYINEDSLSDDNVISFESEDKTYYSLSYENSDLKQAVDDYFNSFKQKLNLTDDDIKPITFAQKVYTFDLSGTGKVRGPLLENLNNTYTIHSDVTDETSTYVEIAEVGSEIEAQCRPLTIKDIFDYCQSNNIESIDLRNIYKNLYDDSMKTDMDYICSFWLLDTVAKDDSTASNQEAYALLPKGLIANYEISQCYNTASLVFSVKYSSLNNVEIVDENKYIKNIDVILPNENFDECILYKNVYDMFESNIVNVNIRYSYYYNDTDDNLDNYRKGVNCVDDVISIISAKKSTSTMFVVDLPYINEQTTTAINTAAGNVDVMYLGNDLYSDVINGGKEPKMFTSSESSPSYLSDNYFAGANVYEYYRNIYQELENYLYGKYLDDNTIAKFKILAIKTDESSYPFENALFNKLKTIQSFTLEGVGEDSNDVVIPVSFSDYDNLDKYADIVDDSLDQEFASYNAVIILNYDKIDYIFSKLSTIREGDWGNFTNIINIQFDNRLAIVADPYNNKLNNNDRPSCYFSLDNISSLNRLLDFSSFAFDEAKGNEMPMGGSKYEYQFVRDFTENKEPAHG